MKELHLGCYGIIISFNEGDKSGAAIVSDMKEPETSEDNLLSTAVHSLESLIVAHFRAGIDVSSPAYLEGIETAYQALGNNINDVEVDDSKVTIQKTRDVSANANEEVHYEVDKDDWNKALEEFGNEETALYELQRECKVKRTFYEAEVGEINAEFDVSVMEI